MKILPIVSNWYMHSFFVRFIIKTSYLALPVKTNFAELSLLTFHFVTLKLRDLKVYLKQNIFLSLVIFVKVLEIYFIC